MIRVWSGPADNGEKWFAYSGQTPEGVETLLWKAGSTIDSSVWEEEEENEVLVPVIQVTSGHPTTGHAGSFAESAATDNSCGTPKQEPWKCYYVSSLSEMKQARRSLADVGQIAHSRVAGRKIVVETCTAPHSWSADCQGQV